MTDMWYDNLPKSSEEAGKQLAPFIETELAKNGIVDTAAADIACVRVAVLDALAKYGAWIESQYSLPDYAYVPPKSEPDGH